MRNPLISVILPVYNGEEHLTECIESVLSQTFNDFEFIIVDDASTDNTPQILKEFAMKDARIKVFTHAINKRQTIAANTACNKAKGNYLARMDADDIAMPTRFEQQIHFLENNPDIGVLGTWTNIIDNNGEIIKDWMTRIESGYLSWILIFGNSFAHSSVMFRRDIAKKVGYYQSPEAEDFDLWSRMNTISKIGCVPEILQQRRVWDGQLNLKVPKETLECVYQIMQKNMLNILGNSISIKKVKDVRKLLIGDFIQLDQEEIINTKNIIIELYRAYQKSPDLDKYENKLISKDVAIKLFTLAKSQKKINSRKGFLALISIFKLNKKFIIYIVLRRILGKSKLDKIQQRAIQRVNFN